MISFVNMNIIPRGYDMMPGYTPRSNEHPGAYSGERPTSHAYMNIGYVSSPYPGKPLGVVGDYGPLQGGGIYECSRGNIPGVRTSTRCSRNKNEVYDSDYSASNSNPPCGTFPQDIPLRMRYI
jgi:hypothetical protein